MEIFVMESSTEELMGSNDHMHIVKRKRTKRPRPPSPAVTSTSSSGGGDHFSVPSTMSSSDDHSSFDESATEEEDMANCLILLAQGGSRKKDNDRKYTVYECKTCNRSFPSFQALGGHRASHKKPKSMAEERKPVAEDAFEEGKKNKATNLNSVLHYSYNNKSSITASKAHECSICGLDFSSGQALGGHMRRHRANNPTTTGITVAVDKNTTQSEVEEKSRNILSLDLNLPAPEDDHSHRDMTFHHFATPTLVDCHY